MPQFRRSLAAPLLLGVGIGLGLGAAALPGLVGQAPPEVPPAKDASKGQPSDDVPYRGLDSNLYMQTSAEYRAACLQAYNLATLRLNEGHAAAKARNAGRPLAVVMDLDETVLDNSGFQTKRLRDPAANDKTFGADWAAWEKLGGPDLKLVPGAASFILAAGHLGVQVFHISNRNATPECLEATAAALRRLGIPAAEGRLLFRQDEKVSDKSARRAQAEADRDVILYVGDNLRDFDDKFAFPDLKEKSGPVLDAAIQARKQLVDDERAAWGTKWVILPNPVYGEWGNAVRGKYAADRLAPQTATKPEPGPPQAAPTTPRTAK